MLASWQRPGLSVIFFSPYFNPNWVFTAISQSLCMCVCVELSKVATQLFGDSWAQFTLG